MFCELLPRQWITAARRSRPYLYRGSHTTGTDQPLPPIGNGHLGAVSRHFGWRSHLRWLRQELRSGIGTCATFGGTK